MHRDGTFVCPCCGWPEVVSRNGAVASRLIDALGGSTAVGRICRVKPQAVSQWRRAGIPDARRQVLELRRPDAFNAVLNELGTKEQPQTTPA